MTQTEAIEWIADLFNETASELTPETPRDEMAEWDSLGVLTLMAEMDEKFGIILSDKDIANMAKLDDILAVLRHHDKLSDT